MLRTLAHKALSSTYIGSIDHSQTISLTIIAASTQLWNQGFLTDHRRLHGSSSSTETYVFTFIITITNPSINLLHNILSYSINPTPTHVYIYRISVTYTDDKDGTISTIKAPIGKSLLDIAHDNDIDLEGACEGSLACSTCHVIVEQQDYYDKIPEPDDDENDMLDLAFGLTDTSRLGCQIICKKELDGLKVRIPGATRNFAVDGFRPKPH